MKQRVIFHIDVNSAFLSWEAAYGIYVRGDQVDLREVPAVIGGDESKRHGIVLAASIPAKRLGVRTAQTLRDALSRCPKLLIRPPCYQLYDRCSRAFIKEALKFSPDMEQFSIDEIFLDMTETVEKYDSPYDAAVLLKDTIRNRLGFTVNVGVASNKLLAKMASDFQKPDRVHTLFPEEIRDKMWPLPVGELFFVGRATQKKLSLLGVRTIGELAAIDLPLLQSHLGNKHGLLIHNYANGIDFTPVVTETSRNKGYGNSITLPSDVKTLEEADHVLLSLSEMVAARLRADQVKSRCICVEVKDSDFHRISHQRKLEEPTDITDEIASTAKSLYRECLTGAGVRLLGVRAEEITQEQSSQMHLFDSKKQEKLRKLDASIDQIRGKYGRDAVVRASFLTGEIDHMTGGVSREKEMGDGRYDFKVDE